MKTPVLLGAGAAALATAASACCVPVLAPLLVSVLGVSGAIWATRLAPYGPAILAGSALLLGYGFLAVYRRRPQPAGAVCPARRPRSIRLLLWASLLVWLLAVALNAARFLTGNTF